MNSFSGPHDHPRRDHPRGDLPRPASACAATERRTVLEFGSLRLVRERRSYSPLPVHLVAAEAPARPPRRIGVAGMIGSAIVGAALAGTLATAAPKIGTSLPYRLTLAVPTSAPVPGRSPAAHRRAPARSGPVAARDASAQPADAPAGVDVAADAEPPAAISSRAGAIRNAMLSGDMQEWREGQAHGYVVAGPIDRTGAGDCRALAVLTRTADRLDDRVEQRRECLR